MVVRGFIIPLCLIVFGTAIGAGQERVPPSDSLALLRQSSEQKNAAWNASAQALEGKIARMLPCDPRVRSAIEEVSRASDARLAALSRYLHAAAAQAAADVIAAQRAIADQQSNARDLETERAEADQERIAVDDQVSGLADSAKQRPVLEDARKKLDQIAASVRQRSASDQEQASQSAVLIPVLRDWVTAAEARQKAIEAELTLFTVETSRWSQYYAARLSRAQTECALTNAAPVRKP